MSDIRRINPIDNEPDVAVGIKLPLVKKDKGLFDVSYTTLEQAGSNLRNLILTRKRERRMQPDLGTNIQDSVFEPNTQTLIDSIQDDIETQVEFWLPYIRLNKVDVKNRLEREQGIEHTITISIQYSLKSDDPSNFDTITVTIGPEV